MPDFVKIHEPKEENYNIKPTALDSQGNETQ